MPAYAFLDRDGALVPERDDEDWRGCDSLELLPGVAVALRALAAADHALVVVTNQYPIGEGIVTVEEYARQTDSLHAALAAEDVVLLDVLHCQHPRWSVCRCAKPGTGLVEEAVRRHGPMDRERSFVVGDAATDMRLAAAVGVRGFLVGGPAALPDLTAVVRYLGLDPG